MQKCLSIGIHLLRLSVPCDNMTFVFSIDHQTCIQYNTVFKYSCIKAYNCTMLLSCSISILTYTRGFRFEKK